MKPAKGRKSTKDEDPVELLLQSAQDDLMLQLNVDSHMSRVSPDYLDSDLDRRFQALKSRPTHKSSAIPSSSSASTAVAPPPQPSQLQSQSQSLSELPYDVDGDLSARFASLKASLPSNSSPCANLHKSPVVDGDTDDEDDEVEKLIEWAKDAARLDPSPPSDDDDNDDDEEDLDSSSSDEAGDDRRRDPSFCWKMWILVR